ncbi:hypothetical protein SBRY_30422 [Actinacidiphila bryophytorum]|uniref:Uncharacterized protein n=1 Tax=Actinacidiphila bryophytorum TaxID=1436133 RepID=A0A9W4H0Z5_9ACTN|nr:hypothetical protein SBRY_30422 [Actinacidiphila bryophytorum]
MPRRPKEGRTPARSGGGGGRLGRVLEVPPAPRRLARTLAALSESSEQAHYEDDPPPCDRTHRTPRGPPCGRTALLPKHGLVRGLQAEAELETHLVVVDLAVHDVPAYLGDLEPVQAAQRLRGPADAVAQGGVHALVRRADDLRHPVGVLGHGGLPFGRGRGRPRTWAGVPFHRAAHLAGPHGGRYAGDGSRRECVSS